MLGAGRHSWPTTLRCSSKTASRASSMRAERDWSPTPPTAPRINIPLDCRDGACGTCKCHCESGTYEMGDYIEDALSRGRGRQGYVLTCQMRAQVGLRDRRCRRRRRRCKTAGRHVDGGKLTRMRQLTRPHHGRLHAAGRAAAGLPARAVREPAGARQRGDALVFVQLGAEPDGELSFLIRDVPGGLMSTYMRSKAQPGDFMMFTGPYGSFYLRADRCGRC